MESGDKLNIAFVETSLNDSMLAEVDDLFEDTDYVDEPTRNAFPMRSSTPKLEFENKDGEPPSFDMSCNMDVTEDTNITDMCNAMADVNVQSQ